MNEDWQGSSFVYRYANMLRSHLTRSAARDTVLGSSGPDLRDKLNANSKLVPALDVRQPTQHVRITERKSLHTCM